MYMTIRKPNGGQKKPPYILDDLTDTLESYAPEGYRFGNTDNLTDYGYWLCPDNSEQINGNALTPTPVSGEERLTTSHGNTSTTVTGRVTLPI